MWINTITKQVYKTGQAITVGEVQYPANIFTLWSKAELATLNIKPYSEVQPDTRYYWTGEVSYQDTGDEVVGTYAKTDRDVDALKINMKNSVKSAAAANLAGTDWMVIRELEGGTAEPKDVKDYRTAVRTASNTKETEIDALTTLAAIQAYEAVPHEYVQKVAHYDEDGNVTYGPDTRKDQQDVNMVTGGWPVDPLEEVDPAFVSLTKI